jgi:hypothetical protein
MIQKLIVRNRVHCPSICKAIVDIILAAASINARRRSALAYKQSFSVGLLNRPHIYQISRLTLLEDWASKAGSVRSGIILHASAE